MQYRGLDYLTTISYIVDGMFSWAWVMNFTRVWVRQYTYGKDKCKVSIVAHLDCIRQVTTPGSYKMTPCPHINSSACPDCKALGLLLSYQVLWLWWTNLTTNSIFSGWSVRVGLVGVVFCIDHNKPWWTDPILWTLLLLYGCRLTCPFESNNGTNKQLVSYRKKQEVKA